MFDKLKFSKVQYAAAEEWGEGEQMSDPHKECGA